MRGDGDESSPWTTELASFAREVRRLRNQAEPTLYPAYVTLVASTYDLASRPAVHVDTNRHTPGAGFPDLTISRGLLCLNWIEIKKPDVSIDPLPHLDQDRFDRYRKTLPHVVATNGWAWRLYERGELSARLDLPRDWLLASRSLTTREEGDLQAFLKRCAALSPAAATTPEEAVALLAGAANLIRLTVEGVEEDEYPTPLRAARESFTRLLRTNPTETAQLHASEFADALAQTTVFGFLLGRIEAGKSVDPTSAHAALNTIAHPFLKNSLYGLNAPDRAMETLLKGPLSAACDMVNRAAPQLAGEDGDWSRVTYVYEQFFALYRPEDRFKFGVFYTPMEITRYQVREVARILRDEFGLSGVTDPAARFLDPACGTGTYLVALAELAAEEATEQQLPVGTTLQELFADRVVGFEVSPGPACVAQARLAAWLRSPPYHVTLHQRFPVYTVNTLTPPAKGIRALTGNLWSDNIGAEQDAGDRVKEQTPVLVILGNPPWGRRDKHQFDLGLVDRAGNARNLLEDWAQGAKGAAQSVYDLYVAFWRFACTTLLEREHVQPARGIVSFITNRTWLRGSPFTTMRGYMRDHGVRATITDLGGDSRQGDVANDESIFAIQAGCAVATLAFGSHTTETASQYRRLLGTREEKLRQLTETPTWLAGPDGRVDAFAPVDWGPLSTAPSVREFFATSMPGVKTHRDTLVVAVDEAEVLEKLTQWNELPAAERAERFHASRGRSVPGKTQVSRSHVRPYRYRPLDNRVLYADRVFIQEPGRISTIYTTHPNARCLQFLESSTVGGPVLIAANSMPDYHSVRGSYGCHTVFIDPVARSAAGQLTMDQATDDRAILSDWAAKWADTMHATAEDVACYLLALGNASSYVTRFHDAVQSEPPRMPPTLDRALFTEAVAVGQQLLAAWCLKSPPCGKWKQQSAPGTALGTATIQNGTVEFENGDRLTNIHPDAASLEVSTYPILQRYLEARAHMPLTRAIAEDVRKVAGAVQIIMDQRGVCNSMLDRALRAPMQERS